MAAHDPNDPLERMLDNLERAAATDAELLLVDLLRWEIRARQALCRRNQRMMERLERLERARRL